MMNLVGMFYNFFFFHIGIERKDLKFSNTIEFMK